MKSGIYKHSKTGKLYKAHFSAKHSETLEDMVVYEPMYDSDIKYWVRPAKMFEEIVEIGGEKKPRFVFIKES